MRGGGLQVPRSAVGAILGRGGEKTHGQAGWEPGGDWEMECDKVPLVLHYKATAHNVKFSWNAGAQ